MSWFWQILPIKEKKLSKSVEYVMSFVKIMIIAECHLIYNSTSSATINVSPHILIYLCIHVDSFNGKLRKL